MLILLQKQDHFCKKEFSLQAKILYSDALQYIQSNFEFFYIWTNVLSGDI